MKRKFILNPASRRSPKGQELGRLEHFFKTELGAFDLTVSSSWEDLIRQTRNALHDGYEQIIALGGDGTVNAIANGFFENGRLINPHSCLAVSRFGSGSDYFRSLAGSSKELWQTIIHRHTVKKVDLGQLDFLNAPSSSVSFVNMATLGVAAQVVIKKQNSRLALSGSLSYLIPTLASLATYRSPTLSVFLDEVEYQGEVLALLVAKGAYMGAGMRLMKQADLQSGTFEVLLVKKLNWTERLLRLPKLYSSRWEGDEKVVRCSVKTVTVKSAVTLPIEFDGEPRGQTDARLSVRPLCLPVCFPTVS